MKARSVAGIAILSACLAGMAHAQVQNPMNALPAQVKDAFSKGDFATVVNLLRPLADKGDAVAQTGLGLLYLSGIGVQKDLSEAAKLLRSASAKNNEIAEYELGTMYRDGRGVQKSEPDAERYFSAAANQGMPEAEFEMGKLYDPGYFEGEPAKITIETTGQQLNSNGVAISKDAVASARWYALAAQHGSSGAQYNLGNYYEEGIGVPQNYAEAARLYRAAAKQGYAFAQTNLGYIYMFGRGVPRDLTKAFVWSSIGASSGDPQAKQNLQVIQAKLTARQIATAQTLATQCVQSKFARCD